MKLSNEFIEKLNKYIDLGYITKREHEKYPISILKYSRDAQLECNSSACNLQWDDVLMSCRGLVIDKDYNVVAKAFDKFFNEEELSVEEKIAHANEKYSIQEKMDGSLIILFNYNSEWILATQKSFYSDIANFALVEFNKLLTSGVLNLDKNLCYGLEFTSPMNRVVVSYGEEIKFTLLIAREKEILKEVNIYNLNSGFENVKEYSDLLNYGSKDLKGLNTFGKEGFVITFESGFRYKVKFENYLKLHYLLTGVSVKEVFNMLKTEQDLNEVLKDTPDEFDNWVLSIKSILENWYRDKENELIEEMKIINDFVSLNKDLIRKDIALFVQSNKNLKNKSFLLSNFSENDWIKNAKTKKYIWTYVDALRKEAQKKEDGLLPISFFKNPNFEF